MATEPADSSLIQRLEFLEHKLGVFFQADVDKVLQGLFETMEPLSLQGLLRELDAKDLELALVGFGPKALGQVKGAMSKKSWEMIKDDLEVHLRQGVTPISVQEARMKVMGIAKNFGGPQGSPSAQAVKIEGLETWKRDVLDRLG